MRDNQGRRRWTYVPEDGSDPVQAWNPKRGAYLPDAIELPNGAVAHLDQSSGVAEAEDYTPPVDVKEVVPWTTPPLNPDKPVDVALGWPGMTEVA